MFFNKLGYSAAISSCGKYRYQLSRVWDDSKYCLPFCMLNPSTADAEEDDPTIRRCMRFAERDGYGGITVVNLFAYRAADPAQLKYAVNAAGPENKQYLQRTAHAAVTYNIPIVCAWGAHISSPQEDMEYVLRTSFARLMCLGKTKWGSPRHPLYVKATTPLEPYP